MKKIFTTCSLLLFTVIINSCTYNKAELAEPLPANGVKDSVSYIKDIKPLMVTYCLGVSGQSCHVSNSNQGAPGNFSTYAGVKARVSLFPSRVFSDNGGMPPSYSAGPTSLTPTDREKLKKWIDDGALHN